MHITQVRPNPSLHPTWYGWLRQVAAVRNSRALAAAAAEPCV